MAVYITVYMTVYIATWMTGYVATHAGMSVVSWATYARG